MSGFDEDRPAKPIAHELGADLSSLAVDELRRRVTLLETEIARLQAEIARKSTSRSAAESLFKR